MKSKCSLLADGMPATSSVYMCDIMNGLHSKKLDKHDLNFTILGPKQLIMHIETLQNALDGSHKIE